MTSAAASRNDRDGPSATSGSGSATAAGRSSNNSSSNPSNRDSSRDADPARPNRSSNRQLPPATRSNSHRAGEGVAADAAEPAPLRRSKAGSSKRTSNKHNSSGRNGRTVVRGHRVRSDRLARNGPSDPSVRLPLSVPAASVPTAPSAPSANVLLRQRPRAARQPETRSAANAAASGAAAAVGVAVAETLPPNRARYASGMAIVGVPDVPRRGGSGGGGNVPANSTHYASGMAIVGVPDVPRRGGSGGGGNPSAE